MLKKKQGNKWIDGNMFWYTYGTTPKKAEEKIEKDQKDDNDDITADKEVPYRPKGLFLRNTSNFDMKSRKVTFVGKIEHEYYDANLKRSNSFIGSPVEKIKGVKTRLTNKLMNYYERVPFITEAIKERFELLLDKMPFFHKPEYTTEILKPDKMPQPKVLRPQDVPSLDSDSNIGILVTIGDNVQPKKTRIPILSSISETFFGRRENSERHINASLDGLMKKIPKDKNFESFDNELNNHNSIDNETPTFFVFEPLDELQAEESITLTKKPSLWEKIKSDKNNTNNNNKIFVICKNKHMDGNNKQISFKGFKIKKLKSKFMSNDPKLPSSNYDYNKKVTHWMKNVENQDFENDDYSEQKENIHTKSSISNKKQGVGELVKIFEKESLIKLPQNNSSEMAKKVNFDTTVRAFSGNVLKPKTENIKNHTILKRSTVCKHFESPPASPSPPILDKKSEIKEVCLKSNDLELNYVDYSNSTEYLPMKRMSSFVEKRKEKKFKKVNFHRSMSAKNILRELVKKTFKLKSLSPSERSYKLLDHCEESIIDNCEQIISQQLEEKNKLKDEASQEKNFSDIDYSDDKKIVPTGKNLNYVENSSRCSISERNRAARNLFFGIIESDGNTTKTDQSYPIKTKYFQTHNFANLNDSKNISKNNANMNTSFEKIRSGIHVNKTSGTHVVSDKRKNGQHNIMEHCQLICDNSDLGLSINEEETLNNNSLIEALKEMNKELYANISSIGRLNTDNKPLKVKIKEQKRFANFKLHETIILHGHLPPESYKIHANLDQHKLFKIQKTKQIREETSENKKIPEPSYKSHCINNDTLNREKSRNTNEFHKTVSTEHYQPVKSSKRRRSHQPYAKKNFYRVDNQVVDLFDRVINQIKNGSFEGFGDQCTEKVIERKNDNDNNEEEYIIEEEFENIRNNEDSDDINICFKRKNSVKQLIEKFDQRY